MTSPWSLIAEGHYEEAVAAFSELLAVQPDAPSYRNRATALLLLGRNAEAFIDIEAAEAMGRRPKKPGRFEHDGDQIRLGVIEWLGGQHEQAGNRWFRICRALVRGHVAYSDASGGVGAASILRFAAVRLEVAEFRQVSDQLIVHLLKRSRLRGWPLPVGEFLSEQINFEELRSRVHGPQALRDRRLCQVHFASAVVHLERGDAGGYRAEMTQAASFDSAILEDEYFLARYESAGGRA